jgi:hypothetical protein
MRRLFTTARRPRTRLATTCGYVIAPLGGPDEMLIGHVRSEKKGACSATRPGTRTSLCDARPVWLAVIRANLPSAGG